MSQSERASTHSEQSTADGSIGHSEQRRLRRRRRHGPVNGRRGPSPPVDSSSGRSGHGGGGGGGPGQEYRQRSDSDTSHASSNRWSKQSHGQSHGQSPGLGRLGEGHHRGQLRGPEAAPRPYHPPAAAPGLGTAGRLMQYLALALFPVFLCTVDLSPLWGAPLHGGSSGGPLASELLASHSPELAGPCETNPCRNGGSCRHSMHDRSQGGAAALRDRPAPLGVAGSFGGGWGLAATGNRPPGYTCDCAKGWAGPQCATDADECASAPCLHAAHCAESAVDAAVSAGEYVCRCTEGWGGLRCERDLDECASLPCPPGGRCSEVSENDGRQPPPPILAASLPFGCLNSPMPHPCLASRPPPPRSCPGRTSACASRGSGGGTATAS